MQKASITETKNNLSYYLDLVRHGETLLITDRDRPIARLEPVLDEEPDAGGRIARLERVGLIRRAHKKPDKRKLLSSPPPKIQHVDLLAALLANREDER